MWAGMGDWASFDGLLEWNLHLPAPASRFFNLSKRSGTFQVTASNVIDTHVPLCSPMGAASRESSHSLSFHLCSLMFPMFSYVPGTEQVVHRDSE